MSKLEEKLAKLEALTNAATPGPWVFGRYDGYGSIWVEGDRHRHVAEHKCCRTEDDDGINCSSCGPIRANNGEFIAASREAVPWLIAQLRKNLRMAIEVEKDVKRLHERCRSLTVERDALIADAKRLFETVSGRAT